MGLDMAELEKKIERKISDLEREKGELKENLKVIRQASIIAGEFESAGNSSNREPENSYEEYREDRIG